MAAEEGAAKRLRDFCCSVARYWLRCDVRGHPGWAWLWH